jgi:chromosome segregation ATPase
MRSRPTGTRSGKSTIRLAERSFKSELERQILEIEEAFGAFVRDSERQALSAEAHLRETEYRLRTTERQKQEAENQLREAKRQLRKLHKTLPVRIIRFFKRLHPMRWARKRIQ